MHKGNAKMHRLHPFKKCTQVIPNFNRWSAAMSTARFTDLHWTTHHDIDFWVLLWILHVRKGYCLVVRKLRRLSSSGSPKKKVHVDLEVLLHWSSSGRLCAWRPASVVYPVIEFWKHAKWLDVFCSSCWYYITFWFPYPVKCESVR